MSAPTELEWKNALIAVFEQSIQDPEFRSLCLSDPAAAVLQASGIVVPQDINFKFFDRREDYLYAFLLPPVPPADAPTVDQVNEMIQWSTLCTEFTTTWGAA